MYPPMDMPSGCYLLFLKIQAVSQNISRHQLPLQVCQLPLKSLQLVFRLLGSLQSLLVGPTLVFQLLSKLGYLGFKLGDHLEIKQEAALF